MSDSGAVEIIKDVGFPIFISLYLLWLLEKRITRLFQLFNSLLRAMHTLAIAIDDKTGDTGKIPKLLESELDGDDK